MPSYRSLSNACQPDELNINSEFFKKRQHLLGGTSLMQLLISHDLHLPPNDNSIYFLKTFIYFSQVNINSLIIKIFMIKFFINYSRLRKQWGRKRKQKNIDEIEVN